MNPTSILEVLNPDHLDIDAAARLLDAMSSADRTTAVRLLGRRAQAALFEAAQGRRVALADVVPAGMAPLDPVICHGKNSLPMFTHFQKRFCRSPDAPDRELFGYNHQSMSWFTGPGYFVAREQGLEVAIDYTRLPTAVAAGWPTLKPNDKGPAKATFGGLVDYLRKVSTHVTIGRATRNGKTLDNWFILNRDA